MVNPVSECPKCAYQRRPQDGHIHPEICPSCGIAYQKWQAPPPETQDTSEVHHIRYAQKRSLANQLRAFFMYVPEQVDSITFWGRCFLWCVFALWGSYFIVSGVDWEIIGGSFLHSINLPFHEFGHVLFSPFGRFMAILGGSLFQVMMPLIALISFSWQMRDNFAASIMLWWAGQNLVDVSPYIADAPFRDLPLILGLGEESHDWGNLLTMLNCVSAAPTIASCSFWIGSLTMIGALTWSARLLLQQKKNIVE